MKHFNEESIYSPEAEPALIGQPDCAKGCWDNLIGEAQMAIRVTLDELALLASIVTADTASHTLPYIPASPERSAYSLLLEPVLFKFPS